MLFMLLEGLNVVDIPIPFSFRLMKEDALVDLLRIPPQERSIDNIEAMVELTREL